MLRPSSQLPYLARFDRATVLATALFFIKRKAKTADVSSETPAPLSAAFKYEKLGRTVRYDGPVQLGVNDLRAIQGLLAIATAAGVGRLGTGGAIVNAVEGVWEELVRACGVQSKTKTDTATRRKATGGKRTKLLQLSVQRLCSVRVQCSDRPGEENLVSFLKDYDGKDGFKVSFCSELLNALGAGARGTHYLKIDMEEARQLKSEAARLLHFRLANVNEGSYREFTSVELESMIWGPEPPRTEAIRKHRRRLFNQAIKEIRTLPGWSFDSVSTHRGSWEWRVKRRKSRFEGAVRKV